MAGFSLPCIADVAYVTCVRTDDSRGTSWAGSAPLHRKSKADTYVWPLARKAESQMHMPQTGISEFCR